ncbi:MAG: GtrA family protein [Firmicutes bacterium]|nr:GtrA family protein [Bacillota bacterium]
MSERNRARSRETLLYLVFGAATTAISYVVFNVCLGRFGTVLSHTFSFVAAVAFAYPTNKAFVFVSRKWDLRTLAKEFSGFVGGRLFTFFFEMGALLLLINKMGVSGYASKLLTSVVVVILNYVFGRLIFRKG